ncbi:MAG: hypothetical protein JNJ73_04300 [Hyphomonadaceae bacterium]|nr:hypothetical protein [Hyphomonadaceae bacterium]
MAAEAATAEHAVGGHGAEAAGHGAEGASAFPPFDATLFTHQLFWFAITFGALYWVLSRMVLPKIGGVIERREAKIKGDLDAAARENDAAEAARKATERTQAESRASARTLIERMRAEAAEQLAAEQARIERELSDQAAAAETRIGEMRSNALAQVDTIAKDVAEDIVTRLTKPAAAPAQASQKVRA